MMEGTIPDIAVVGINTFFPGPESIDSYWKGPLKGGPYKRKNSQVNEGELGASGLYLPPVALPDAASVFTDRIIDVIKESGPFILNSVKSVIEECLPICHKSEEEHKISLFMGFTSSQDFYEQVVAQLQRPLWEHNLKRAGIPSDYLANACKLISTSYSYLKNSPYPGLIGNLMLERICKYLSIHTYQSTVNAKAPLFSALALAVKELQERRSDFIISGVVDTMGEIISLCSTITLNKHQRKHLQYQGGDVPTSNGGVGLIALKRLCDAKHDGNEIFAVIKSCRKLSSDEHEEYKDELLSVYSEAGYHLGQVGMVKMLYPLDEHSDIGLQVLNELFACPKAEKPPLEGQLNTSFKEHHLVSSTFSNFLILQELVMSVYHQVLVRNSESGDLLLRTPSEPTHHDKALLPWMLHSQKLPRRACLNFFESVSKSHHITIEEWSASEKRKRRLRFWPAELFLWGAVSRELLAAKLTTTLQELDEMDDVDDSLLSFESQQSYQHDSRYRVAIVAGDLESLKRKLETALRMLESSSINDGAGDGYWIGEGYQEQKLAVLFSGESPQSWGGVYELAVYLPQFFRSWQSQLHRLSEQDSEHLINMIFTQDERLKEPQWAHLVSSGLHVGMWDLCSSLGIKPHVIGGHGLGELTALYAGGALESDWVMPVARSRGKIMGLEASSKAGTMLTVFAPEEAIKICLDELGLSDCFFARYDAPKCHVMAGSLEALATLEQGLSRKGILSKFLSESAGFHSPMVIAGVEPFEKFLQGIPFTPLRHPVYSGRFASPYPQDPVEIPALLASQISHPVRFQEMVEAMHSHSCNLFIEIGPHEFLSKMMNKIIVDRQVTTCSLGCSSTRSGLTKFLHVLGLLISKGVKINTEVLWDGYSTPKRLEKSYLESSPSFGEQASQGASSEAPNHNAYVVNCGERLKSSLPQPVAKEASMPNGKESIEGPAIQTSDFLDVFKEVQKQTADAHEAFQKSMAEAHLAYLKSAEESFKDLASLLKSHGLSEGGESANDQHDDSGDISGLQFAAGMECAHDELEQNPQRQGAEQISKQENGTLDLSLAPQKGEADPNTLQGVDSIALKGASKSDLGAEVSKPGASNDDIKTILLREVAQKTGYPLAMLDMGLSLEGDLGIDPAKKADLISSLSDKLVLKSGLSEEQINLLENLSDVFHLWQAIKLPISTQEFAPENVEPEKKKPTMQPSEKPLVIESSGLPAAPESFDEVEAYRHVLRIEPSEPLGLAIPCLWWPKARYKVLVSDSGTSLSPIFCDLLKSKGINAVLGRKVPDDARAVIFLGGLRPATSPEEALAINGECFTVLSDAVSVYGGKPGAFITVQDTGGRFGFEAHDPIRCYAAGLPGISKTLGHSQAKWSLKSIDIDQGMCSYHEIAKLLFDELAFGGSEQEVGLRSGDSRVCLQAHCIPKNKGKAMIEEGDLILVAEGTTGVASQAFSKLIEESRVKLILIGSSQLQMEPKWAEGVVDALSLREAATAHAFQKGRKLAPLEATRLVNEILESREIQANISKWRAQGHDVDYLSGEGLSSKDLGVYIEKVREKWGPIKGFFDGSGLEHIAIMPNNSLDEFHRVFSDKVIRFKELLSLLDSDPLKFICLFSLPVSIFRQSGQTDHAMANEVLGKVALKEARRRGGSCYVKHIFWEFTDEALDQMVPREQGVSLLKQEMCEGEPYDVEVVLGPFHQELAPALSIRMDLHLDRASHSYLLKHVANGKATIPMAMVIDWFNRLVLPLQKKYPFCKLGKLKVHQAIELDPLTSEGVRFSLIAKKIETSDALMLFASEVCSLEGLTLYSAEIELSKEKLEFPKTLDLSGFNKDALDPKADANITFSSTPGLQSLKSVGQVDDRGGQASLTEKNEGWGAYSAAYDGGLQLALLWSEHVLGGASVPTEISKVYSYLKHPEKGPIRCILKRRHIEDGQACSDMYFLDKTDQIFAKFEGISTCRHEGA